MKYTLHIKPAMISAMTLFFATAIGAVASSQSTSNPDETGKNRTHGALTIFVDAQAGLNGDGSAAAPYQTILQAIEQAREIRQEKRTRILVRVAPGEYVEDFPIYLNVSNLELRGSTRLIEDEDGLPQNCGSDIAPAPCVEPGTETVITPILPLAPDRACCSLPQREVVTLTDSRT